MEELREHAWRRREGPWIPPDVGSGQRDVSDHASNVWEWCPNGVAVLVPDGGGSIGVWGDAFCKWPDSSGRDPSGGGGGAVVSAKKRDEDRWYRGVSGVHHGVSLESHKFEEAKP